MVPQLPEPHRCLPITGTRGRQVVRSTAQILARLAASSGGSNGTSHFDCVRAPGVPLEDYAALLFEHLGCSPECYALAVIFLHRYLQAAEEQLRPTNAHRLLLTSVFIASKVFDDFHRSSRSSAAVGGMRTADLNNLEAVFLKTIGWRVYVSEEDCARCMAALQTCDEPRLAAALARRRETATGSAAKIVARTPCRGDRSASESSPAGASARVRSCRRRSGKVAGGCRRRIESGGGAGSKGKQAAARQAGSMRSTHDRRARRHVMQEKLKVTGRKALQMLLQWRAGRADAV